LKKIKPLKDLREGTAKLQPGMYLYVIMLGDPDFIRLIHEDHLVHEGIWAVDPGGFQTPDWSH